MGTRKGEMFCAIFLLSWTILLAQESHWEECPEEWSQYSTSCYHANGTAASLQEATETCEGHHAHLVFLEQGEENRFVTGFMDEGASRVWLGARYDRSRQKWFWAGHTGSEKENQSDVSFNRWAYGLSPPAEYQYCSAVRKDGWWDFEDCSATLPFVCEKRRSCQRGWYHADCSSQCHCHQADPCRQGDGVCPRGCSQGWTGASCSEANPMPEASFHCLRSDESDLRADLTVNVKGRQYSVIRAVSQEGRPLDCALPEVRQVAGQVFVTLLLPAAFAQVNRTDDAENNGTDEAAESQGLHLSTPPTPVGNESDTTVGSPGAVSTGAGGKLEADDRKRDVSSGDRNSTGAEGCVASRSENSSVTWLIEFKEFPDVLTGNDVTVEVTCDLDDVDDLESVDSVVDDSEKGEPVEAAMLPVTTSVYLTDHKTGRRVDHFHLGQRLQLHVHVQGLADKECAYPHSCVLRPEGAAGQEVQILDEDGCGKASGPVDDLSAQTKGHFTSADFPAFSLGTDAIELECQVHVEPTSDPRECQTSCRKA